MARRVEFEFDPFQIAGVDPETVSTSVRKQVLSDVQDYVLTSVLEDTAAGKSAVDGSKFPALTRDYKKKKLKEGGQPIPNLELSGDMLASLRVISRSDKLTLTVAAGQGDKADGHNNHSGESRLPLRRFIPLEGEDDGFRTMITRGITDIVTSAVESDQSKKQSDSLNLSDFVDKNTRVSLKGFLD